MSSNTSFGERRSKHYIITKRITNGAFGEIHIAVEKYSNRKVAIKVERETDQNQLKNEFKVYRVLNKEPKDFIPRTYGYGSMYLDGTLSNGLVLDLLGPSLETLFKKCKYTFSLSTVLKIGDKMLSAIEFIHSKGYLHRDIKPDNFVLDNGEYNFTKMYIIDFGLAKLFRSPLSLKHISLSKGKSLTGTARYASLNSHLGFEQSRRDDLESFVYCLIYFLKGRLPWQGAGGANKEEKFARIRRIKEVCSISKICEDIHPVFAKMLYYVRGLGFDELPCYYYLSGLLRKLLSELSLVDDGLYDWHSLQNLESNN